MITSKQDLINDFILDNEVISYDYDGNKAAKGIWIDEEDYSLITELINKATMK